MMCNSHVAGALSVGVGFAAAIPHAPLPVRVLAVVLTGGAGLLPDLDHPGGKASRSLGLATRLLARAVASISVATYHATRTDGDRPGAGGGHRKLTHTVPGAVAFGVAAGVMVLVHPVAGAVAGGVLCGLMALGFRSLGAGFTLAGAGVTWWTLTHDHPWSWVIPVAVVLGSLAHIGCDMWTSAGVPVCWPFVVHGERWYRVTAPVTFSTGTPTETTLVTPMLWMVLAVSCGVVTGVLPALLGALARG